MLDIDRAALPVLSRMARSGTAARRHHGSSMVRAEGEPSGLAGLHVDDSLKFLASWVFLGRARSSLRTARIPQDEKA